MFKTELAVHYENMVTKAYHSNYSLELGQITYSFRKINLTGPEKKLLCHCNNLNNVSFPIALPLVKAGQLGKKRKKRKERLDHSFSSTKIFDTIFVTFKGD